MPESKGQRLFVLSVKDNQAETLFLTVSHSWCVSSLNLRAVHYSIASLHDPYLN